MRWFIAIAAVFFVFLAGTAFFGGLGFAAGGGDFVLFPRKAEAYAYGGGTALAVYENQGQISTTNAPVPQSPTSGRSMEDGLFIVVFFFVVIGVLLFVLREMGFTF